LLALLAHDFLNVSRIRVKEKMEAQDMILDDITRKKLIWYGHVERMGPT
jgi:hypothetical protein